MRKISPTIHNSYLKLYMMHFPTFQFSSLRFFFTSSSSHHTSYNTQSSSIKKIRNKKYTFEARKLNVIRHLKCVYYEAIREEISSKIYHSFFFLWLHYRFQHNLFILFDSCARVKVSGVTERSKNVEESENN